LRYRTYPSIAALTGAAEPVRVQAARVAPPAQPYGNPSRSSELADNDAVEMYAPNNAGNGTAGKANTSFYDYVSQDFYGFGRPSLRRTNSTGHRPTNNSPRIDREPLDKAPAEVMTPMSSTQAPSRTVAAR
jgi:hypothetical protein